VVKPARAERLCKRLALLPKCLADFSSFPQPPAMEIHC
jgi:hypothetical protein